MKKYLALGLIGLVMLATTGCPPIEVTTRNGLTASYTFLSQELMSHPECHGGALTPTVCKVIHDAIVAHNSVISAEETYCGGTPAAGVESFDNGGPCVPVKSAQDGLKSALANLNQLITDLKGFK